MAAHRKLADLELGAETECRGNWWLPGAPEDDCAGSLAIPAEGLPELHLIGSFAGSSFMEQQDRDVVHGVSEFGESITLLRNLDAGISFASGGTGSSKFYSEVVMVGAHLGPLETLMFDHLEVGLEHLEKWLRWRPFKTEDRRLGSTVRFQLPPGFRIRVPLIDAVLSIEPTGRQSFGNGSLTITYWANLRITPSAPQSYAWFMRKLADLEGLLALITGQQLAVLRLRFAITDASGRQTLVSLLVEQVLMPDGKDPHWHEFLFTHVDVVRQNPRLGQIWFENIEELRPTINLLVGPLSEKSLFVEFQFLSSMQALEAYHRRSRSGQYVSEADYLPWRQVLIEAIPAAVPADLRASLKARLKWGYEFSLRKRMQLLFNELHPDVCAAISRDLPDFIESVVVTRNSLVHSSPTPDPKTLSGRALHRASERLRAWLLVILLKHVGFDDTEVLRRIRSHRRWQRRLA